MVRKMVDEVPKILEKRFLICRMNIFSLILNGNSSKVEKICKYVQIQSNCLIVSDEKFEEEYDVHLA